MTHYSDKNIIEFAQELFSIQLGKLNERFITPGWRYQGATHVACKLCDSPFQVFRKHYSTAKGDYEYWGVVCTKCRSCTGLDELDKSTTKQLREWANLKEGKISKTSSAATKSTRKRNSKIVQRGTFTPTEEQVKIVEAARGNSDISIEALAGTGKTTTLKLLAEAKPKFKGNYIAFNRSIVDEAKSKFPSNVVCSTAHGLAYRAIGRSYASRLNGNQRLSFNQVAEWLGADKYSFQSSISNHILEPAQVARYALATVQNFCKSIDFEMFENHVEMPLLIASDVRLKLHFATTILPLAEKIWNDVLLHEGFMRFSHDYYLKMWQLARPTIGADYILFDEAQDADPVMLDVINSQSHAQLIYCGDQFQAIYEWRGAINALKMVHVDEHLWLTQSFRFGEAIASEANVFLGMLNSPKKIQGLPSIKSKVQAIDNPKAILCRNNAGVISALISEQQKGRNVAIIGRTEEFIDFAEACKRLMEGSRTGHPELAPFMSWQSVLEFVEEYPKEAQEIKTMVELINSYSPARLIAALKEVVSEEHADVVISTAHKAKGREWNSVKLHGDFLHLDDMDLEDLRLAYVAITRAKVTLDKTAWEMISPLGKKVANQPKLANIGKVRPPIELSKEPDATTSKGLAARIGLWKKR
jgi:hypothetical protein